VRGKGLGVAGDARPASPHQLPRESWADTLKRTVGEFREDKLQHWAAALTYYAVLSVFPALLVLVSLIGLFADPARMTRFLTDVVAELGPASAVETFQRPIEQITANRGTAGVMAIVGILAALWSASGYVSALADASNTIYEVREGRPFWKLKPLQLLVTLAVVLLVAITVLALVLTGPLATAVGSALGVGSMAVTIWGIAKWPVLLGLVLCILSLLYYTAPNAKVRGIRWVSGGSLLALIVWAVASVAFAFYVSNFGSYSKVYGTLGGVVVFLLWLWLTNIAVLLGAEFNAETERARQLVTGVPDAEKRLRVPERDAPSEPPRQTTA
jgi:membrane protein